MLEPNLYAFYGSLRRGLANYQKFKPHLRYRYSQWVNGFQLYSFGEFPFAYKTNLETDRILVEVFEITSTETQQQIDALEFGYGYHVEQIILEGQPVNIYLFRDKANYPLVSGGDWVKFFRG
ncbi:MAG: gamma-glutamylcyclotransferase [Bacteroidetes bacterium]|nr:gamma-glutamylcyclotransferase [Bacteroidota bacterium]